MIDVIRAEGVVDASVLDLGAGVGAIHTACSPAGRGRYAIEVDASREYLATARAGAERRGAAEPVEYRSTRHQGHLCRARKHSEPDSWCHPWQVGRGEL